MPSDDDWTVAFAEARAAIEQDVFVGDKRISEKADGGDVVDLFFSSLIQRFNVGQDVVEFHAGQTDFACGQGIEHESVIAVGRMREANLCCFWEGCWCGHAGSVLALAETLPFVEGRREL